MHSIDFGVDTILPFAQGVLHLMNNNEIEEKIKKKLLKVRGDVKKN